MPDLDQIKQGEPGHLAGARPEWNAADAINTIAMFTSPATVNAAITS